MCVWRPHYLFCGPTPRSSGRPYGGFFLLLIQHGQRHRVAAQLLRWAAFCLSWRSKLEYRYSLEDCDVPEVRRAALGEYRIFRRKCLEYIRGAADTSVMNQVHDLAWHTVVFRTLNEARRLEPERLVNGALWELTTAGYASLMSLGIRKLVDRNSRTDSLWNVVELGAVRKRSRGEWRPFEADDRRTPRVG